MVTIEDLTEVMMPDWSGVTEEAVIDIFKTTKHRSPEAWWAEPPSAWGFRSSTAS